ncbi:MAG: AarF/UbiB family protein, partial [Chloroflexota bacterium]
MTTQKNRVLGSSRQFGQNGRSDPTISPFKNPFIDDGEAETLVVGENEPKPERDLNRFLRILFFFARVILHVVVFDLLLTRVPLLGSSIRFSRPRRFRAWSRRFRILALAMGGVLIKLGQFLSARVDVLPIEVTEELIGLQDEVPSEDPWRMFAVLEHEIGSISTHFAKIEEQPLAAASLGQTHRAWLKPHNGSSEGDAVVVKIQRPEIEKIVNTDLEALYIVARWLMRYQPIRKRANVPALMKEFGITLWEELDYRAEVANLHRFEEIHANDEQVYIPKVYESLCSERVIVLENVESIKIMQVDRMIEAGINPKEVADVLLTTYFKQVFQIGFFHADPHPGNLFVMPRPDAAWTPIYNGSGEMRLDRPFWLVFVDFGMVGRVPDVQGELLQKVLISIAQQDARGLTESYDKLGFFLPGADLERIVEAQTEILERIYGRNLLELARPDPEELKELGEQFRDLLFDFPLQVPQDFIYLGRAIGIVSGLVSMLDEDVNPWYFIEKFGQELVKEQVGQQFKLEN